MTIPELHDLLVRQMLGVHSRFPDLLLEKRAEGAFVVTGALSFRMEHEQREILDSYEVEIRVPPSYPQSPPAVKEVGGRIPKDFHTHADDETLCLGAPLAVSMAFAQHPTLLGYIERQVVPFLFGYSYKAKYGAMPFGELPHGTPGILQYYRELFGVDQNMKTLGLLKILADGNYRGHMPCPCGKGPKLRNCHGPQLLEIKKHRSPEWFVNECVTLLVHVKGDDNIGKYQAVLPKEITEGTRRTRKR